MVIGDWNDDGRKDRLWSWASTCFPDVRSFVDFASDKLVTNKWVRPLLPGKASGMDIDFLIERRGHFLAIEQKRRGAAIPAGELIALRALNAQPNWQVLTVWIATSTMAPVGWSELDGPESEPYALQRYIADWWGRASKNTALMPGAPGHVRSEVETRRKMRELTDEGGVAPPDYVRSWMDKIGGEDE